MKKILKFLLGLFLISAAISLGMFVLWIIGIAFVVSYIFKAKDKCSNFSDFFKEGKNIAVSILAVILVIVLPFSFIKSSKEYDKELKEQQKQQAILDEQKSKEEEENQKENERASVLNAKSKVKKDKKAGKTGENVCVLTEDEIEKYNITKDEIEQFNKDREKAIIKYEEKELSDKYRFEAKRYIRDNASSYTSDFKMLKYGFNEDKTRYVVSGSYKGKNQYGAAIRVEYEIEFNLSDGEVVDAFMGNEKII